MSALRAIVSICGLSQPAMTRPTSARARVSAAICSSRVMGSPRSAVERAAEFPRPLVDHALGLELEARQRIARHRLALEADVQGAVDARARFLGRLLHRVGVAADRRLGL